MSGDGTVYKVCTCKDATGRKLGAACRDLRKPRHGAWYYQFRLTPMGKQHRRGGFTSQSQAYAAMDRARAAASGPPPEPELSTGEWLQFWLEEKQRSGGASAAGRKVAATTARGYASHLELYLLPALGAVPLRQLQPRDISELFRALGDGQDGRARPLAPASVRRIYATLRSALNAAVKQQKIDRNPALLVDLASATRPKAQVWTPERVAVWQRTGRRPSPVMVWTPDQTGAFLDSAVEDPLYALYNLIALRGLRRGEAVGLSWSDVDLDGCSLLIREQVVQLGWRTLRTAPKAGSERGLALDTGTVEVLRAHRLRQRAELEFLGLDPDGVTAVFTRVDGQPVHPDYVTRHFTRLITAAALPPIRVHDLRHGAATLALASGVAMKVVQEMLGHSSITITSDTYTSVLPQVARAAAQAAADLVPRRRADGQG
ncbi:MAG: site-specific integrase [Actinomycetota bacterium]|nr:site-specific integrase [Actinomycetota bacterium]